MVKTFATIYVPITDGTVPPTQTTTSIRVFRELMSSRNPYVGYVSGNIMVNQTGLEKHGGIMWKNSWHDAIPLITSMKTVSRIVTN